MSDTAAPPRGLWREPGRSWIAALWWKFGCVVTTLFLRVAYGLRVDGREHLPRSGSILFISNHQSYLDPAIDGAAVAPRAFTPVARESLFRFKPFAWLIRSYGAVAVAGDAGDAGAVRQAITELAAGRTVLVYPEGTRSVDGTLCGFHRGFLVLLRRAETQVVPIGIDGAYEIWPRGRYRPRWAGRIHVVIGKPIASTYLASLPPKEALQVCEKAVDELRLQARASLRARSGGSFPPPGPADRPYARSEGEVETEARS